MLDTPLTFSEKQRLAEELVPLIGSLYREFAVSLSVHGRSLVGASPAAIVKAHGYARKVGGVELSLVFSVRVASVLKELAPRNILVDLGQLAAGFSGGEADVAVYLREQLSGLPVSAGQDGVRDVVLYGFGRIGRILARILVGRQGESGGLRLRAVVVRRGAENDLFKRANLLRRDSVHGPFNGVVKVDRERNVIHANGTEIQVIYSSNPAEVDYAAYGISDAIVVDNTGRWRDEQGLGQHLQNAGVSRVLLTAPGKGDLPNIVFGVNSSGLSVSERIVSAASCTTNAITPVLKVLDERFGVVRGHVETVHAYTNDQNLIDNFHKGDRRGRGAALNMVLTETGAASAVAKALPSFAGKLTGNAIRVPTPDVSMAVLNLQFERETTREELNGFLRDVAVKSALREQIDYVESPEIVSTDFVGSTRAGVVDGLATIVTGVNAVVYVWYDNEFGYSCQVVRLLEQLAGVQPVQVPFVK